jgi:hypothetical protein
LKISRSTFKNHEDVFLQEMFGKDAGENNCTQGRRQEEGGGK